MTECGFLRLPTELRMQIFGYLLTDEEYLLSETPALATIPVVATQPAISLVCRQIRIEALSVFYRHNVFVIKLFDMADVAQMIHFLELIGDFNVGCLQRIALCGWAKMGFGHMMAKWWWRCDIDLRRNTLEWDRRVTWSEEKKLVQSFRESFADIAPPTGNPWTSYELAKLMTTFTATCTAY